MKILPYDYNKASRYDDERFIGPFGTRIHQLETKMVLDGYDLQNKHVESVLEVGCGTGRLTIEIERLRKPNNIFGIDPSIYMLKEAQKKSHIINWKYFDGITIPFSDNHFSFVYCVRVLNQTKNINVASNLIREMIRVTRTGGIILVEYVNSDKFLRKKSDALRLPEKTILDIADNKAIKIYNRGILLFSMTFHQLFDLVGGSPFWHMDRILSAYFPRQCSRCYIALRKVMS